VIEHDDAFSDWDAIIAGEEDPFELSGLTFEWRTKTHHTIQRDADGRPIAHVGLLLADVEAGGEAFAVVGVGGVIVNRFHRGQGLLRALLDAALARDLGPERALLWCTAKNAARYAHLGFEEIGAPVLVQQSTGELELPLPAMWKPLRLGATWPAGAVRVPGRPF
jgi:GNAT superfamily N-acetyltransferase